MAPYGIRLAAQRFEQRPTGGSAGIQPEGCSQLRASRREGIMAHNDEPFGPG
jgi:hypothetical protein